MADNTYRFNRGRDAGASSGGFAGDGSRGEADDPLAELARLIGQDTPMNDAYANDRHAAAPVLDHGNEAQDWAADPHNAQQNDYVDDGYDARYDPPRLADPEPAHRLASASREADYAAEAGAQFAVPRARSSAAWGEAHGYAAEPPRYDDPHDMAQGPLPAFLPQARDARRDDRYDDEDGADHAYAADDYEEDDAPSGRRRGGLIVAVAVLGLAVLGTAGAFAYRSMFGGSMLPSLPPIIRADNGPNKILPNAGAPYGADHAANNGNAGEKLVSREEQPVTVAPATPAPRVVSTIPIFPDPTPPPAALGASGAGMGTGMAMPGPAAAAPMPVAPAPAPPPPSISTTAVPANPPAGSAEPKKIHTLAIRPDQMGANTAAPAQQPAPAVRNAPPPPRQQVATAPPPRPAPASAPMGSSAPMSIVPSSGGVPAAPPPRTRTALAQPTPISPSAGGETTAAAGGNYAVQITSQRSEAEAQASFRALKAKYPGQLAGHEPIIRQADLGSKGVYYRALVGPYASAEQAAELCSSLKAAGGNCIVQRN